jgi:BirA family biotin operon repressor/biotin-[acetyl-CoA-carboxylase] ligase
VLARGFVKAPRRWELRDLPVCASTETELERWLTQRSAGAHLRLVRPRAVLARHQRFGHGQHGRFWQSPPGGIWLSAALPWAPEEPVAAAPGLCVAVGLLHQLEALGLEARLKWPNDLLLQGRDGQWRKLAGLLSGLRLRGARVRWARIGLGFNGCNPVPRGATNLVAALGRIRARPRYLLPRVFAALDWAMAMAEEPELVRQEAEARLWLPSQDLTIDNRCWHVQGLTRQGGLALLSGDGRQSVLHRSWPEGGQCTYIGGEIDSTV